MSHDHDHGSATTNRKKLAWAFGITAAILVAEVIGAFLTNSLALLVDAAHMLTDSTGLLLALTAATLIMRKPTAKRTWGFRRAEVLSATLQSTLLLGVGIYAFVDGIRRLFQPAEIAGSGLLIFGIIGLLGNVASMLILASGKDDNLNMRAAFLEVANDALGSVAVIISAHRHLHDRLDAGGLDCRHADRRPDHPACAEAAGGDHAHPARIHAQGPGP